MTDLLVKLNSVLTSAVRWLIIVMMATMTCVVFAQVMARYFFNFSLSWSEEVARFAFVWLSFIGAAILIRRDEHIRVSMFVDMLPTPLWAVFRALQYVGVLICLYFFVVGGFKLSEAEWSQLAPATQIPMGWVYLVIPGSSLLMLLWTLCAMAVDIVQGRPRVSDPEHVAHGDVALTQ